METEIQTPQELLTKYRYKGKLTPKLSKKACELVEMGTPKKSAVIALGVGESTYRLWRDNSEDETKDPKYKEFFEDLEKAEQKCFSQVAHNAVQATKRDGKVAMEFLSRRDGENWSKHDTVDVQVNVRAIVSKVYEIALSPDQDDAQEIEEAKDEPPLLLEQ